MVLAYEKGAKYILVFDSNKEYSASILTQEHFDAMRRFRDYANANPPRQWALTSERVAYVLPKDYGYGFRGPNDKIWGLWNADNLNGTVCNNVSELLTQYGEKLDIVYDIGLQVNGTSGYSRLVFWNGTSRTP
jgi:hypothetical protein